MPSEPVKKITTELFQNKINNQGGSRSKRGSRLIQANKSFYKNVLAAHRKAGQDAKRDPTQKLSDTYSFTSAKRAILIA